MRATGNFWLALGDAALVCLGYSAAYLLRFDLTPPPAARHVFLISILPVLALKLSMYRLFGLYRVIWQFIGMIDLRAVVKANALTTVVLCLGAVAVQSMAGSKSFVLVAILDGLLGVVLVGGARAAIRLTHVALTKQRYHSAGGPKAGRRKRAVIIGAGEAGEKIYREIRDNPRVPCEVVGFLDDDPQKVGLRMHGMPVLGVVDDLDAIAQAGLDEIIIAIKSVSGQRMREIVEVCQRYGIESRTIPVLGDILDGHVMINRMRRVDYEDLLGRLPVKLNSEMIGHYLHGKTVLVTGGVGSIGSELCRQIAVFAPKRLIVFDNNESGLYDVEMEFANRFRSLELWPVLGDVRAAERIEVLCLQTAPDVIFHAAGYKHVPMMEAHPWEAVENNVLGTLNVIRAAASASTERFVLVSTDKAVRPASVMGATKRIGELLTLGANGQGRRRSMIVRFGNVAGSQGSVIPLFKKQIELGGPVTVTHPDVTRYFMTIAEAAQLILQAGGMGRGGEIFLLDMGTPIRLVDLARDLIRLSGFEPTEDIEIRFTGLRPGEKLVEQLVGDAEHVEPTAHEKILVIRGESCDRRWLLGEVEMLVAAARRQDGPGVRACLQRIVPDYASAGTSFGQ